jgi:hypothetical protein
VPVDCRCFYRLIICFNTRRGLGLRQGSRSLRRISGFITHSAQLKFRRFVHRLDRRVSCFVSPRKMGGHSLDHKLGRLFCMDPSTVCLSVFVALISTVAMFRIYKMNSFRVKLASYRSQTMCPACHAITARAEANCLRCGKPLRAV